MFEHWRGHGFIRIHSADCNTALKNRDSEAEHAMELDGQYETLQEAEAAANQKVNRWKACTKCIDQSG